VVNEGNRMDENQDPKIFEELANESRPKTDEDIQEDLGPDPSNSPPEAWIEDLTADEVDVVVNRLQDEHPAEDVSDETSEDGV